MITECSGAETGVRVDFLDANRSRLPREVYSDPIFAANLYARHGFPPIPGNRADRPSRVGGQRALFSVGPNSWTQELHSDLRWKQLLEHYAIWHGELWPLVLAWLAATPFVWSRGWIGM